MSIVSPTNPTINLPEGTWRWNSQQNMAQWFPNGAVGLITDKPTTTTAPVNTITNSIFTGTGIPTKSNAGSSAQQVNNITSHFAARPSQAPPPSAPDLALLRQLAAERKKRQNIINLATKDFSDIEAATQAMGFQSAANASRSYANRNLQAGINPVASGVVEAQARMPVYGRMADIRSEKSKFLADSTLKADTLAAQIAETIGNIQLSYAKTLADYNASQTQYDLDLNKFNASQALERDKAASDEALRLAALSATTTGGSGGSGSKTTGSRRPSWRDMIAGTLASAGMNSTQQVNRADLGGFLSRNRMWDEEISPYAIL